MNNNFLNEYISIRAASRKTSISRSTISLHLKDNTKTNGRELYGNMVEMSCWIVNNNRKVIINMKK